MAAEVSAALRLELKALVARQRPGYSLDQAFYRSRDIFELERSAWLPKQWFIVAHGSEVPRGSYIVRDLLDESIIITRDETGQIWGLYNVCRHRGSRLCEGDGHTSALLCPYHAWSYRLNGTLRSAPALPFGIDTATLGLKRIPVHEISGLIVASLSGDPAQASMFESTFRAGLEYHGINRARIAARRSYPTQANWKLVIENFVECYHCIAAHPEYSSVMEHVQVLGKLASSEAKDDWQARVAGWWGSQADRASPLMRVQDDYSLPTCAASRGPIGEGRLTQSQDGHPVAPLMGRQSRYDGGVSVFRAEPFIFVGASNDHAVLFQFSPRSVESTDVTLTWLVAESAAECEMDVDRLTWLWDVTTRQDKLLIERNARGIASMAYEPGPYSQLESLPARFVARYLNELSAVVH